MVAKKNFGLLAGGTEAHVRRETGGSSGVVSTAIYFKEGARHLTGNRDFAAPEGRVFLGGRVDGQPGKIFPL